MSNFLDGLRKSFPQLDDWVNIYPSLSIRTLVAEVFKQVIDFARDASYYFTRFSSKESFISYLRKHLLPCARGYGRKGSDGLEHPRTRTPPAIITQIRMTYRESFYLIHYRRSLPMRDIVVLTPSYAARLLRAVGRPPSMGIDLTVREISEKLAAVNAEAMIQLHKRSQKIQLTVEESNTEVKELKRLNNLLIKSYERIEAEYDAFRQEVEGLFIPGR